MPEMRAPLAGPVEPKMKTIEATGSSEVAGYTDCLF